MPYHYSAIILDNVKKCVKSYEEDGCLEKALFLLKLNDHDDNKVDDITYLNFWSKIYAEIRH